MRSHRETLEIHGQAQVLALKIQAVKGGWTVEPRMDTIDAVKIVSRDAKRPYLHSEIAEVNTPDGDPRGHAAARLIAAAPETAACLREAANNMAAALGWLQSAEASDATKIEMAIEFLTKGAEARLKALNKAELGE